MIPSKKLQAEWNKKLRDSGFQDIETPTRALKGYGSVFEQLETPPQALKQYDGNRFYSRAVPLSQLEATRDYYIRAEHFLNSYMEFTPITRLIWELHMNGKAVREIEHTINVKNFKKSTVHTTVVRLAKIMMETPVEAYDDNQE